MYTPQVGSQQYDQRENQSLILFAVLMIAFVLLLRFFVLQPFRVQGSSMQPNFSTNEYLLAEQVSYRLEDPMRGDVVIFKPVSDPSTFFIKRVIALPGETIEINNNVITIFNDEHPDGFVWLEPYLDQRTNNQLRTSLLEDEYFVMGDNRGNSSDSRSWGALPRKNIVGRVLVRLWPPDEIDIRPGDYKSPQ